MQEENRDLQKKTGKSSKKLISDSENPKYSFLKRRIFEYLELKGIKKKDAYEECGITNGTFSSPGGITEVNIIKFLKVYRDFSIEWFFLGEGPMIKEKESIDEEKPKFDSNMFFERIELLSIKNNDLKRENDLLKKELEEIKVALKQPQGIKKYSVQDVQNLIAAEAPAKLEKE